MVNASRWPEWLGDLWAKSAAKGDTGQPETLARHTWNVLERLAEMIRLRPTLPQTLQVPRLWHILFWAAFLHDFGKVASGFQSRLRGGSKWPHRHEVLSLAFVDWIASTLLPDEEPWVVAAIVSHHKDAAEIQELYPPPDEPDEDQLIARVGEMGADTLRGLWRWLAECSALWINDLGLDQAGISVPAWSDQEQAVALVRREGVARINHWLGVYRRFVKQINQPEQRHNRPLIIGTLTLRGHIINADYSASAHAGPLPRVAFSSDSVLSSSHLLRDSLYRHQWVAEVTRGSALLTAPTGSGKTEAALLWAARQATVRGGLPRLFYTLPYQASMNAMKLRLDKIFPGLVGLQHGRSLLALYRLILDDYAPEEASRQAKRLRELGKLNYPPIRIFSPYQMLKGMYRLKGYEVLLSDYHGGAFVFDEIHAYEVERLALILKTIEYLSQGFGADFLVMSATFPTLIKGWLRQALGNPAEIVAEPALFERFRRHRLVLLDGELLSDAGLERISADAIGGRSVLVTCNLVDRAQAVYLRLRERLQGCGVHLELLHGRFNMRDRSAKEKLVREAAGLGSIQRQPIVLVATQVVEVSLDIDLDTIYTDPAPLEALVQRFGRINRQRGQSSLAPVHIYRQPDDGQRIYDPMLVNRTLAILERENDHPVEESAISCWLDEIYSGEVADRWQDRYAHAASEFEDTCIRPLRAFEADYGLEDLFYKAFDGIEVLPDSFCDEYQQLQQEDPIVAGELLVPISWRRYYSLANKGRVLPREREAPPIVRAAYSQEMGLSFEDQAGEDDWD